MFVSSPKFICWNPDSWWMVLGHGFLGRWLGLDEVLRVEPHVGISVFTRRKRDQILLSLPCEETRRQLSANQEEGPHHTQNLLTPWPWASQTLELWEIHSCCLATQYVVSCYNIWIDYDSKGGCFRENKGTLSPPSFLSHLVTIVCDHQLSKEIKWLNNPLRWGRLGVRFWRTSFSQLVFLNSPDQLPIFTNQHKTHYWSPTERCYGLNCFPKRCWSLSSQYLWMLLIWKLDLCRESG